MKHEPNKFKLISLNILTEPQSTGLYKVYKDFYWFITKDNEILSGYPAINHSDDIKNKIALKRLPELLKRVKKIETLLDKGE